MSDMALGIRNDGCQDFLHSWYAEQGLHEKLCLDLQNVILIDVGAGKSYLEKVTHTAYFLKDLHERVHAVA